MIQLNKKLLAVFSTLILTIVLLGTLTFSVYTANLELVNRNNLLFDQFASVFEAYEVINANFTKLVTEYDKVITQHNELVTEHNRLIEVLDDLLSSSSSQQVTQRYEVHSRVRMWKDDVLVFDEYNAGNVTDLGDNMTLLWIFGDTGMGTMQPYTSNCTWISIGDANGASRKEDIVELPSEWNRTTATFANQIQSALNISCTFYPDAGGPYNSDCIGINCLTGIGTDDSLIFFDSFTRVTGIDETFTINVEFKVSLSD